MDGGVANGARAKAAHWYGLRIVFGGGKLAASGAVVLAAGLAVAGCGEGSQQNADETVASYPLQVTRVRFPRQAVRLAPRAPRADRSQHRAADGTERRGDDPVVHVPLGVPRPRRPAPTGVGRRKRPGTRSAPAGQHTGSERTGRCADRLREHLGARAAVARPAAHVPLGSRTGQARPLQGDVPRSPAAWRATPRPWRPAAARWKGSCVTRIAGEPPPTYVNPKTGEVVQGEYH